MACYRLLTNGLIVQWIIGVSQNGGLYNFPFSIRNSVILAAKEGYDGELGNFAIGTKRVYPSTSDYTNNNVRVWGLENTRKINLLAIGY